MSDLECVSCGHSWTPKKNQKPYKCPCCFSVKWQAPTPEAAPDLSSEPLSVTPSPILQYPTYSEAIRYLYLGQPLPVRLQTPKHKAEILAKEKLGHDCHKPLWSLA